MSELLLELFSEEIPARMQKNAAEALKSALQAAFDEAKLSYASVETFVTPRRIVAIAKDLPQAIAATETEKRGPKLGAPEGAIAGFCKGAGVERSALEERDGYYFAMIRTEGGDVAPVLKGIIEKILAGFHWPKSMRWGAHSLQWVRPLQSILCLFDGKVIPVSLGHVTAGDTTKGHRFLSDNQPITIHSSDDYFAKLRAANVIVQQDERREAIASQAEAQAAKHGLQVKPDAGLLEEVTGLVEWPVVLVGGFEEQYLALPQEVPTTVMRAHQKYFALQNAEGALASKFIVVANMTANDGGKAITAGNERVLRARLSDGQFFYDQDLKTPLADWNNGLTDMVFHAKIGSVAKKVERIKTLAATLAERLGTDATAVARAAELCKADLTTGMVGEFPELQGLMGRYYALAQGEKPEVADAIRDHYSPLGPNDDCPHAPVSVAIALADKLDTLSSLFAIGEKPTGSKDPFALRRAALGVIRLILENKLHLSLPEMIRHSMKIVGRHLLEIDATGNTRKIDKLNKDLNLEAVPESTREIVASPLENYEDIPNLEKALRKFGGEVFEFFIARLKVLLKDEGISHDRIDAVLESDKSNGDLTLLVARVHALDSFLNTAEGSNLLAGAKRAINILKAAKTEAARTVDSSLLQQAEEKALFDALTAAGSKVENLLAKEEFAGAMGELATLRGAIDAFFEQVVVNADDEKLRANRLALLQTLVGTFYAVADFSLIEG